MKRSSIVLTLIIMGASPVLMAGAKGALPGSAAKAWIGALSFGPVWSADVDTQTFYVAPDIIKTWQPNDTSHALGFIEVFGGQQKALNPNFQTQLGIAVAATTRKKFQGIIQDDADPQFSNYAYQFKAQHGHVALKGKLLAMMNSALTPWVSASLGVGFNRAHNYTNIPLIFEAVPNSNFGNHTQTAITWSAGAGVQKAFSQNMLIGVGYEFSDWGRVHLAPAYGQTLNTGLGYKHIYTNGVLVNLTLVA